MKEKYIQGIFNEYMGKLNQKQADLDVLLDASVGVGDHGSISDEIKKKISEIDKYSSLISTMQVLFAPPANADVASTPGSTE